MTNTDFLLDGVKLVSLPAHYINHPKIGPRLVPVIAEELELEKVVIDSHELPLEQRISKKVAKADAKSDPVEMDIKEND